jgi:hypothetical protein
MLVIHAVEGKRKEWMARPHSACNAGNLVRPFRGRPLPQRNLLQCGPGVDERCDLSAFTKYSPGTMFQGVQPIQ